MKQPRELLWNLDVLGVCRVLAAAAAAPPVVFRGMKAKELKKKKKVKKMEEATKFQLSPCPPSAREGEIKREQFRIVPRAQLVPKVVAFMKFQTLA